MSESLQPRYPKCEATFCPAVELHDGAWYLASSRSPIFSRAPTLEPPGAPQGPSADSLAQTAAMPENAALTADDTMALPMGAGRRRRARPGDVALLGALASGPVAAQTIAVPWAVGFAPAGALADPSRAYRPPAALGPATLPAVPDGGLPRLVAGDGHGFRVQVSFAEGIAWGAGHWPFLPRVGVGGQGAWFVRKQTTQAVTLPPAATAAIVRRATSRWWPLAHRLGLDWGPWALPVPKLSLSTPLKNLAPGDSVSLSRGRIYMGSIGVVLGWLRLGPQLTGHTSATLALTHADDGHLHAVWGQAVTGSEHQVVADLPIVGAAYTGDAHSHKTVSHFHLDMATARGQLTYLLLRDVWAQGGQGPTALAARPRVEHASHTLTQGISFTLPWTLMRTHPRAWGVSCEAAWGVTRRHDAAPGAQGRGWVRVERDHEGFVAGSDAWRLTVAGGPSAWGDALAITYAGRIEAITPAWAGRLQVLLAQTYLRQQAPESAAVNAAAAALAAVPPGALSVKVRARLPLQALAAAARCAPPPDICRGAQALGVWPSQVADLVAALGVAAPALMGGAPGPLAADGAGRALTKLLQAVGPAGLGLVVGWLAPPDHTSVSAGYGYGAELAHQALSAAATAPTPATSAWLAQAARLGAALDNEVHRLHQDPVLAWTPASERELQDHELRQAAAVLRRAAIAAGAPVGYGSV